MLKVLLVIWPDLTWLCWAQGYQGQSQSLCQYYQPLCDGGGGDKLGVFSPFHLTVVIYGQYPSRIPELGLIVYADIIYQ